MTKHNKRRVAVVDDGEYVGVLEDIDLLELHRRQFADGRGAHRPRLEPSTISPPPPAAIEAQVRMLRRQGVRVEVVAEIVSDLNRHLFAKLFAMTASPSIRERGCLIVMGCGRARRADDAHRPGQRPHPRRAGRRSGAQGVPRRLFRRARALRLSALPGRRDGRQSAMVEDRSTTIAPTFAAGSPSPTNTRR